MSILHIGKACFNYFLVLYELKKKSKEETIDHKSNSRLGGELMNMRSTVDETPKSPVKSTRLYYLYR